VNLAADTLRDESAFVGYVLDEIRKSGGRAEALSFEILESDALLNRSSLTRLMLPLRSAGCSFALSGHAGNDKAFELAVSLGFSFIKIDGSMLRGLVTDAQALERLTAVNRRCREYGISTVCMQVEDGETLEILRGLGVDYAQGFGVEPPRRLERCS
jgi:EAL domain-containing protein (putative c-di-GMP-specific phosphodiesterase class I)